MSGLAKVSPESTLRQISIESESAGTMDLGLAPRASGMTGLANP